MWTTNYERTTTATRSAVWAALEKLHSGSPLGPNSDTFQLHGPFAVGTTLTITPQGQEPMQSTIIALDPEVTYADRTVFGDLELTFQHDLTTTADGGTAVTHTLVIEGPGSDEIGPELGPQISNDFPVAMAELLTAAEHSTE